MPNRRVLVIFAHPAFERSHVNRHLLDTARAVPGVEVHDLYEVYPAFNISPKREQVLLLAHDVIVFQHPFYWYSVPALLKEWQDLVLEHGWAYGAGTAQLAGKLTLNATTTGGGQRAYEQGGSNNFSMRQFLTPWEQTANLCKMKFLAPFVVHGALAYETAEQLRPHLDAYRTLLGALVDDRLDLALAAGAERLDAPMDRFLKRPQLEAVESR